jgi:meiotically up-regulated gene 157 (Mug157) protein
MIRESSYHLYSWIIANDLNRTTYQLFIPANMMFSRYLDSASEIMANIGNQRNLANHMHNFAGSIRDAITKYGIVDNPTYGQIYAFEVDGYGSRKYSSLISRESSDLEQGT